MPDWKHHHQARLLRSDTLVPMMSRGWPPGISVEDGAFSQVSISAQGKSSSHVSQQCRQIIKKIYTRLRKGYNHKREPAVAPATYNLAGERTAGRRVQLSKFVIVLPAQRVPSVFLPPLLVANRGHLTFVFASLNNLTSGCAPVCK